MFNLFLIFSIVTTLFRIGFNLPVTVTFDVTQFGAVGNGLKDDSKAFLKTWDAVCGNIKGGVMVVPLNKTYLLSPLVFQGPCKFPTIEIQMNGALVAPKKIIGWTGCVDDTWIVFSQIDGLHIYGNGNGAIDAQGLPWWNKVNFVNYKHQPKYGEHGQNTNNCKRPTALRFKKCNNLQFSGLKHINPPKNHISITGCNNVNASKIEIIAPEKSPNTDGFDISTSSNINITDSIIGSGDDCFAINSGCSNISIKSVTCGPGHGISVGSLGDDGSLAAVEGIFVDNCTLIGTTNGVRIKTWEGGKGYARNITFQNIILQSVKYPIIIDQHYCNGGHNCPRKVDAVEVSHVKYINITGTSVNSPAILLDCSNNVPCKDIVLDNVKIEWDKTSTGVTDGISSVCNNVKGTITSCSPSVPCLDIKK